MAGGAGRAFPPRARERRGAREPGRGVGAAPRPRSDAARSGRPQRAPRRRQSPRVSCALGPRAPLRVSGRPAGGPGPVCRGGTDGPALVRESRASQKPKGNSGGKVPATGDTVWCARRPAAVSGARDTRTWGSPAAFPSRPSRGRTGGLRRWAPAGERAPRTHDPWQGPQRPRARAWTTAPNAGRGGGSGWPASPDLWGLS